MKNQEIITLIGQKRAYNSSSFLLRVEKKVKNSNLRAKNIAILASKKNFKTAVLRNKVRRLVKNALNKVILDVSVEKKINKSDIRSQIQGYNLVFSPKKGLETMVFKDLVDEMKQNLMNNGII
jgi:ribonuclease P protein component